MVEFRWVQMPLFGILVLHVTAAATGRTISVAVRAEDEVTFPCENVIKDQLHCESTTWVFSNPTLRAAVELIALGRITEKDTSKSARLSLTANCSLVMKKVQAEDAGRYDCQQYKSNIKQHHETVVHLSVVKMTEQKKDEKVTLNCSVSTESRESPKMKWLFQGRDVDKNNKEIETSEGSRWISLTIRISHFIYTPKYKSLTCEVTAGNQAFPFRLQPSAATESRDVSPPSGNDKDAKGQWWLYVTVAVVSVALLAIVMIIIRWNTTKGKKTRMNDNVGLTSDPAVNLDTVYPEDGVSYVSISYTKTNSKGRRKKDDDDDDAVTYTTVKLSSPDQSNLYATMG